jgi:excisionase family DNA binding protein
VTDEVKTKVKNPTVKDKMRSKGFIPVSEAAKRVGMSIWYIYELLDSGKVHGVAVGTGRYARRFVEAKSLIAFVGPDAAKLLGLV